MNILKYLHFRVIGIFICSVLSTFILMQIFLPSNLIVTKVDAQGVDDNYLQEYSISEIRLDYSRLEFAKSYLIEQQRIAALKIEQERQEALRLEEERKREAERLLAAEKAKKAAEAAAAAAKANAAKYYNISNVSNQEAVGKIRAKFGANADKALAIANCESRLQSGSVGDTSLAYWQNGIKYGESFGLFQIRYLPGRPSPEWLLNIDNNIQKAYEMSGGGTKWSAWSCAKKVGL